MDLKDLINFFFFNKQPINNNKLFKLHSGTDTRHPIYTFVNEKMLI